MSIQWGRMVTELSQVKRAAADGFEFAQVAGELVDALSERQVSGARDGDLPFTVCSVPLPPEVRVTQKGFNLYVWTEHLKGSLARMAKLGCRKLVWSNGRARVLPVEGDVSGLKEQVLQFLFVLCEVASNFDITVLVEPLGPRRTNYLNTMKEVEQLLGRVGKRNLGALISLREQEAIGLSLPELASCAERIGHVHMEHPLAGENAPSARTCPRAGDGYEYRPFLQSLRQAGYAGTISLPEDADAAGLAYCRSLWGA